MDGVDTATKLFYLLCKWRQYQLISFIQKPRSQNDIFRRLTNLTINVEDVRPHSDTHPHPWAGGVNVSVVADWCVSEDNICCVGVKTYKNNH